MDNKYPDGLVAGVLLRAEGQFMSSTDIPQVPTHASQSPVIETVLSVQFSPIPDITSGHFGWFWKEFLDSTWVKVAEVPPLPDQFEKFGGREWAMPSFNFSLSTEGQANRLQIINAEDDRVIQLQSSRFIYNWRKRGTEYPRFKCLYPEFLDKFGVFCRFLAKANLGQPTPNQWEVTYINHVPKGDLWQTPNDWHTILPRIYPAPIPSGGVSLDTTSVDMRFEITPKQGRLHVSSKHGKIQEGIGGEVIVLQLTARGPIHSDMSGEEIGRGLEIGHQALIQSFSRLASDQALKYWGVC